MKIFNPTLKKDLVEELQYCESRYFTFDKPVPFKAGLTLYPVSIQNYEEFMIASSCLLLNKNETTEGLMMSHLDYLVSKMEDEKTGRIMSSYFSKLCEIVFHIQNGMRCKDCGQVISFKEFMDILQKEKENACCPHCGKRNMEEVILYKVNPKTKKKTWVIMGVEINSKDFDRFRQIVMYQNLPDYKDDSWVLAELREDQRLKSELLMKKNGGAVSATLEKKMVCVSAKSCYKIEEIYNMSMRKFIVLLASIDDAMTYECDRIGLMSGLVTSKTPLEHWIYKKDKSLYDAAVDAESYKGQIEKANGGIA